MGAAAGDDNISVAEDDAHRFERHHQKIGDHLGEARLMALAGGLGADDHVDMVGADRDAGLLLWRADGGLDIIGEPAPAQQAALGGGAAAGGKAVPIGKAQSGVHVLFVAAAVIGHADGIAVGHGIRAHQIAAAQRDAVEAVLGCGNVDQPFDGKGDLGAAGAAIGLGRHGVGEDGHGAQGCGGNGIAAGDQPGAFAQRRQRDAARAGIADIGGA